MLPRLQFAQQNGAVMTETTKSVQKTVKQAMPTRTLLSEKMSGTRKSKTWGWPTDPMFLVDPNGGQVYKLDTLRFAIIDEGNTGYTLSWNATSLGWQSVAAQGAQTPHIVLSILNSAQGVLDSWDIGSPDWLCGGPHQIIFTNNNGQAGIIVTAAIIDLNIAPATWASC
jgi:hypothetical protein